VGGGCVWVPVSGDSDRPIRIVVESISSRRREALADVEAGEDEVEERGPMLPM
jgi:hypothetical protein